MSCVLCSRRRFLVLKIVFSTSHTNLRQQEITPLNPPHRGPTDDYPLIKKVLGVFLLRGGSCCGEEITLTDWS